MKILMAGMAGILALTLQQSTFDVSGVVIDAATKRPVADARVWLARADGVFLDAIAGVTDGRGAFQLRNVGAGSYRPMAAHADYVRSTPGPTVMVGPGQPTDVLSIAIVPTGVVAGRVVDELGDPAPRIFVRLWVKNGPDYRMASETTTNDLGEYRLFGLVPGTYVLGGERYKAPSIESNVQLGSASSLRGEQYVVPTPPCPDCRGEGRGFVPVSRLLQTGGFISDAALTHRESPPVFYGGTTDRDQARPIDVAPGARLYGIDLQLVSTTR